MKIKSGDKVKILKGKDKGKTGKVMQVFPSRRKASVEGLNQMIKHLRPRREGEKGQRVEFPAPISLANLMLVCPQCNQPGRIGYQVQGEGQKIKKIRICKKCNQAIG